MNIFLYVFDAFLSIALLPTWAVSAVIWRVQEGKWTWVSPVDYARQSLKRCNWTQVVLNNIFWAAIIGVCNIIKSLIIKSLIN